MTPRIVVEDAPAFLVFLRKVFGATGDFEGSRPAQMRIGDSIVMVSAAGERDVFPAFLYVYVEDPDSVCTKAEEEGAEVLEAVGKTPYGDRRGMVRDRWGNVWQIASPRNRG